MGVVSITLDSTAIQTLASHFDRDYFVTPPPYARYQIRYDNCVITAYTSGKVVFQGATAEQYASRYANEQQATAEHPGNTLPQCGSDEVGTGDYFGPVVVCACALDVSHQPQLRSWGVRDSKQLSDAMIRTLAPQLIEAVPHSLLILDNATYNAVHRTDNMNAIKAKLHNQCYLHLEKKLGRLPKLRVVDQFTPERQYYRYLAQQPEVVSRITFVTKAENQFDAVACASIIARYGFLKAWDAMEQTYDMTFHKGAGALVDADIQTFVARYGKQRLEKVAKLHFKNTEKIA